MALDYGGTFVVNLARRSISPRQFGRDKETGEMKSVLFQKAVCFIHANAGGFADTRHTNILKVGCLISGSSFLQIEILDSEVGTVVIRNHSPIPSPYSPWIVQMRGYDLSFAT